MHDIYDLIIVGAGPVGLMLANFLKESKLKIAIVEKKIKRDEHSKAIGISPVTLNLLSLLNLSEKFISKGVKVEKVVVHGTKNILGTLTFNNLNYKFNFILSLPQKLTETLLEENLNDTENVHIFKGYELIEAKISENKIKLILEYNNNKLEFLSRFLAACDGSKSKVREIFRIKFIGGRYKETFLMGDFIDNSTFNNEAHLFFTQKGSLESFPLPEKKRRWIVATESYLKNPPENYLIDKIKELSGIEIEKKDQISLNPFGVQHYLGKFYLDKKIIFCGDSAHVFSPIGGQGMNTGFNDAYLASFIIKKVLLEDNENKKLFQLYEKYRKKATKVATKRAWMSMKIGTLKGKIFSLIRNFLIKIALILFERKIALFFSMLTIPYNNADKIIEKKLFSKKHNCNKAQK